MSESEAVERNRMIHEEALRRAKARNQDETLNWNGGEQTMKPSEMPAPSLGHPVIPVPDCSEGQCSGVEAIINHMGRK
jgi:hypothetical protein